jgi:hypothetical protein
LREEGRLRVFENRVLSRIFGHKRDEVRGEWRKLHIEYHHDMHSSPNIVRMIKSKMRWAMYVARMVECRGVYRILLENLRERDHLVDPDVDGSKILRWLFKKWDDGAWTGCMWLRIGTGGGHL